MHNSIYSAFAQSTHYEIAGAVHWSPANYGSYTVPIRAKPGSRIRAIVPNNPATMEKRMSAIGLILLGYSDFYDPPQVRVAIPHPYNPNPYEAARAARNRARGRL